MASIIHLASSPRLRGNVPLALTGDTDSSDEGLFQPLVLIVDDQFTGRKILDGLVRTIDPTLQVESYADPRVALERASIRIPDLILVDYKMPGMNGVDFTQRLRTIPGCEDVPLVIITVVEDPRIRYEALDAGATDFLTRPIDQHECQVRCRNLLTMRKQQRIIKNRAEWLEHQVAIATRQILVRERETLLRLAKAGEFRDEETGNHVLRMARYSRLIAEGLALTDAECEEIELAAPMHDIGKIGIPDCILLKPGRLTDAEMQVMRTHTNIGYDILNGSPSRYVQLGAVIALGHHEKHDGSGYPHGLQGKEIPLAARIVAVADVYDALTSVRPYKPAWSSEAAVEHIVKEAGKHFDPDCVNAFLAQISKVRLVQESLRDEA